MWSDNETTIDLLGFDYLVDSLEVVLTQPRLLPVTVGVLGDWGSGKTSLLRMVGARLGATDGYVVVPFSPWRYEAYEDVKAALMDAVLGEVAKLVPPTDLDQNGLLHRLRLKVARIMAGPFAAGRVLAPAVGTLAAAHMGISPALGAATGSAVVAGVDAIAAEETTSETGGQPQVPTVFESVSDFRDEFETLVRGLDAVRAVVVLIDDLDRCLDDTVIDVFEAIRLFLQASKTAFVIAANREIVQAAVERRYPAAREGDATLGKDYLEKIVQVEVTVPPLAAAEAETYLNLLFADLRLNETEMELVRDAATEQRRRSQFAVAMNYGIALDVLGTIGPELQADFTIANRIAPTLSRGLRGNPRQLKRFLNTLLLRLETAKRRSVELDAAILAKLMVLERAESAFQQLFLWQVDQDGTPEELTITEETAKKGGDLSAADVSQDLKSWYGAPAVRSWLDLEPPLAGVPLGEYFFFSRDRLSPAAPEARLSAKLQSLLSRMLLPTPAQRRAAIDEAAILSTEEFTPLFTALLDRAGRSPESSALSSAMELTAMVPENWPTLGAMLGRIPPKHVPTPLPLQLAVIAKGRPEVAHLFEQWAQSGHAALVKAVAEARKGFD
jgi:KAP-like P-loop domain-containing protein